MDDPAMTRSARDQPGGHPSLRYNKEGTAIRRWWNRKARRRARAQVRKGSDPQPTRRTQGWLTW